MAIANSGGGTIIVGVKEDDDKNLEPTGLDILKDKADISNEIKKYLPFSLFEAIDIVDFSYSDSDYKKLKGKSFQVLFITTDMNNLPYIAKSAGKNIKNNVIYVRREGISEEASHEDVQRLINQRIDTGYSSTKELSLEEHLNQLKVLYKHIASSKQTFSSLLGVGLYSKMQNLMESSMGIRTIKNPNYPDESFEEFISKIIGIKKTKIEIELNIKNV